MPDWQLLGAAGLLIPSNMREALELAGYVFLCQLSKVGETLEEDEEGEIADPFARSLVHPLTQDLNAIT